MSKLKEIAAVPRSTQVFNTVHTNFEQSLQAHSTLGRLIIPRYCNAHRIDLDLPQLRSTAAQASRFSPFFSSNHCSPLACPGRVINLARLSAFDAASTVMSSSPPFPTDPTLPHLNTVLSWYYSARYCICTHATMDHSHVDGLTR